MLVELAETNGKVGSLAEEKKDCLGAELMNFITQSQVLLMKILSTYQESP